MKRVLGAAAVVVGVILVVAFTQRVEIVGRLLERVVARNMQTSLLDDLPDGLHVVLCGAGSPLPDPNRSGPCTAIIAGDDVYLVDAGNGASRILAQMRLSAGEIDGILLTHFHSDHIDGLGELLLQRWANAGHDAPVPLHGPPGVAAISTGLDLAYANSRRSRVAHHGDSIMPNAGAGARAEVFAMPAARQGVSVLEEGGLEITAFRVDHAPVYPAVGYRFDYKGRSVVVSGDTTKSDNVMHFSEGVDLLVHEALSPELVAYLTRGAERAGRPRLAKITSDIVDYHTSPVEAAEVARDAGVGFLLFNHIVPPLLLQPMETMFLEGVSQVWPGRTAIGRDGTLVKLPAGGDDIVLENVL